ncbi:MAG: putative DNA repair protein MutK [Desulforhopalus sp.]|jgi:predicted DNA repair protein MutK
MTGGIFAVLDDIAVLLDDVAVMSKVAAKKTAGILGDDLAVNAEKATGFQASRELPVLWAITKGSFLNKIIILPLAFLLSAYAPWLIVPILLLGGAYLSYEGVEKIYHLVLHKPNEKPAAERVVEKAELLKIEAGKIKSAVRTDFILSIEIVMIALGTVMAHSLMLQVVVVSSIALLATVGVYGVVALLVRMDDVGFYMKNRAGSLKGWWASLLHWSGELLIVSLPQIIRILAIVGTVAMLMVGGGMFVHNIPAVHHAVEFMPGLLATLLCGLIVGSIILGAQLVIQRIAGPKHKL